MTKAAATSWNNWVIESDSTTALNAIKQPSPFATHEPIAEVIRHKCSLARSVDLRFCPRKANILAHELARLCINRGTNLIFADALPLSLENIVTHDMTHV